MRLRKRKYILLLAAALLTFFAILIDNQVVFRNLDAGMVEKFQQKLNEKERLLDAHIREVFNLTASPHFSDYYIGELMPVSKEIREYGAGFLVYRNNELLYWSSRNIAFDKYLPLGENPDSKIIHFPNGYYLSRTIDNDSLSVVGLILIKTDYAHENKFLENKYQEDFRIPRQFKLLKAGSTKGIPVYNIDNEVIFSMLPEGEIYNKYVQIHLPVALYVLAFVLFIIWLHLYLAEKISDNTLRIFTMGAFLFLIYWLHILFKIPKVFTYTDLFSPAFFAYNFWLPSLGDFFIVSLFFFYFMFLIYKELRIVKIEKSWGIARKYLGWPLLVFNGATYLAVDYFIRKLIYNSNFSFTLNKINEITLQTFFGIASIMLLLFGLAIVTIRIIGEIRRSFSRRTPYISLMLTAVFLFFIYWLINKNIDSLDVMILFVAVALLSSAIKTGSLSKFGMSYQILIISALTIFSLDIIYKTTIRKEREIQQLLAITLVAEHDPAAEVFLGEIQEQINRDPNIQRMLFPPFEELEEYLERTYFSGFFRQYDLQITICGGNDSITVLPQNEMKPCFQFFRNMIEEQGSKLPGTNFYYMDNMNGRISYFGELYFPSIGDDYSGISIFIELNSRLAAEGIGFPELLIDKSMKNPDSYKRFEYAKYYGGELVNRYGDYPYNTYIYSYNFDDQEFTYNTWDGYEHLIYCTKNDNYVIVSRSLYTFVDYLISFPYLFVFYFISSVLILMLTRPLAKKTKVTFDLKFRVQASIISIVFVSLLLVAAGTIFYNLKDYRSRLEEDLNNKMNSVSVEIDMLLQDESEFDPELIDWMSEKLISLSNIFNTDINIFGTDGDLVVSSRLELFNKGLVSRKMSARAYYELFENFQDNYFQPEEIGNLRYQSAYTPIINNKGRYLGSLNLPYFTHQDKYSQEVSTFIVAFINLYVLLFLASIFVAVFISNQITRPLVIIREKLRKMDLGKRNEHINYKRDDEIGKLVEEYNKKVDELAVSADLLARSERESAWREMAKQIAHEIKNPLTPMKLNIQHLQRFAGSDEEYRHAVNRVAQTLIDQIDTLSNIATEFSNFAKIPTANRQEFALSELILKVISLYENDNRANILFNDESSGKLMVNADMEQLSRALINLIKNGIQAIPSGRKGKITIGLAERDNMAVISVNDNGTGIPENLREKMFSPNFTTKSSGMGLGLAIVKNTVENFGGRVWFTTESGTGSTFYLEIPATERDSTIQ